jgi:hypothetical protein
MMDDFTQAKKRIVFISEDVIKIREESMPNTSRCSMYICLANHAHGFEAGVPTKEVRDLLPGEKQAPYSAKFENFEISFNILGPTTGFLPPVIESRH